ncbi:MAG: hypothetical protein WC052_02250 [Patescibacteria group bacterium]|jgi:hypothetical protein
MSTLTTNRPFEAAFNEKSLGDRWLVIAALVDFVTRANEAQLAAVAAFAASEPITTPVFAESLPCTQFRIATTAVEEVQDAGAIHTQALRATATSSVCIETLAQLAYCCTLSAPPKHAAELLQELVRIARTMPRAPKYELSTPLLVMMADAPSVYDQNAVRYGDYAESVEVRRHIMNGAVLLRKNPGVATPLYEGRSP